MPSKWSIMKDYSVRFPEYRFTVICCGALDKQSRIVTYVVHAAFLQSISTTWTKGQIRFGAPLDVLALDWGEVRRSGAWYQWVSDKTQSEEYAPRQEGAHHGYRLVGMSSGHTVLLALKNLLINSKLLMKHTKCVNWFTRPLLALFFCH